ncbi:hypothetical protein CHS0354_015079 [Potamilus streckersoni]|uniref:Peptide-N-glycosidase F N-terminal domain-containing protein n=1 Tax=Potamilus streckersoni TaxID=2493646 RepID=A0AAE0WCR6_9BIVA|nr:hypothetical protein CHS0354_015079 [Potamilus streckersoni]
MTPFQRLCFMLPFLLKTTLTNIYVHKFEQISEYNRNHLQENTFESRSMYNQSTSYSTGKENVLSRIPVTVRKKIADRNLGLMMNKLHSKILNTERIGDGEVINYKPGDVAEPFIIYTLNGILNYSSQSYKNTSFIFHVFDPNSGFLENMWTSDDGIEPLFNYGSPVNNYVFIPKSAHVNEKYGAIWMKQRVIEVLKELQKSPKKIRFDDVIKKIHFSILPANELGNWLPTVFQEWQCVDHLCGLDQVFIQIQGSQYPIVLKRLDARYDWLPSAAVALGNKTLELRFANDGCKPNKDVNGSVALVMWGTCSTSVKILMMQNSGAVGLLVMMNTNQSLGELTCDPDCSVSLDIPASSIPYFGDLLEGELMNVTFQNTPSDNFFIATDTDGRLAEVGWFLYPTMHFLVWQAQWFEYMQNLDLQLNNGNRKGDVGVRAPMDIMIFSQQVMQGDKGVVANVSLPAMKELSIFRKFELVMSLSCPGERDTTCAHWDHTIQVFVCCNPESSLCGMELGRWISPFRRRIGIWLSDVSSLLPLLAGQTCMFTMKTAPWAMPWIPSLWLRFSQPQAEGPGRIFPAEILSLYQPGATFDKNYNTHFPPMEFQVPKDTTQIYIYAVITGHGSDENGCGEFCVTSHHFNVNGHINNITFSDAGTALGCADQVSTGVIPNEHGTWLYGRDGWCDGRNVFPWVIDVTDQLLPTGEANLIKYFGWFNGSDPNPQHNPGEMIMYSYLVYYKRYVPLS